MNTNATFQNLYQYIQTADRDDCGFHDPWPDSTINPKYMLHIYDGRRQVNIVRVDGQHIDRPIANFVVRPDENEVVVYSVDDKGRCDYDNGNRLTISTEITRANGWGRNLRDFGTVNEILQDILGTVVAAKQKKPQETVNAAALYAELGNRIQELNAINDSYPRTVGSMVMVNAETEDRVEALCNYMYGLIARLESQECTKQVDSGELKTYMDALAATKASLDANMQEVSRARGFLATYCSR